MDKNQNLLIASLLSFVILILWQLFYINPQIEQNREAHTTETHAGSPQIPHSTSLESGSSTSEIPAALPLFNDLQANNSLSIPSSSKKEFNTSKRIIIDTPSLSGSINLSGGRIDDLKLKRYRLMVDSDSPMITLLKPESESDGYFIETGFTGSADLGTLPGSQTAWIDETQHSLSSSWPVVLSFLNDKGLSFRRSISIDEYYMFTVSDTVVNNTSKPISLSFYGRATRFNQMIPPSNYILHEGLIGVTGNEGLEEISYANMIEKKQYSPNKSSKGWLGITDKYWAVSLIPPSGESFQPRFSYLSNARERFQADFLNDPIHIPPGGSKIIQTKIFAGAKEVGKIYDYQNNLGIPQFELLIDWGWFYFITNPMFHIIDFFHKFLGNFGLAILATTVLVKMLFFPLASKSYRSMANMKKIHPKLLEIREKYSDDKIKQHQAIMELYKIEKINPLAGCWPVLVQIPVFFGLYKVLYVTIEMRHSPFFGWIHDLAAPDPLSVFNLFGLINFTPPSFFMVGAWPLIMGITMFLQMRMNPAPTDPAQAAIFNWMPVLFTFMLASFPAGLVIYWAWNNFLSILQQGIIMKRSGVRIEIFDNIKALFEKNPKAVE